MSYYEPCYYPGPFTETVSHQGGYSEVAINVPDSKFTVINNWENSLFWMCDTDAKWNGNQNDYFGLLSQYSTKDIDVYGNGYTTAIDYKWLIMYDDRKEQTSSIGNAVNHWYRRKKGTKLVGKIYSEEEFRKIAWFYCPGTSNLDQACLTITYPVENPGEYGTGDKVNVSAHEMNENVEFVYRPETTDCSTKSLEDIGQIVITIVRKIKNGNNEEVQYSIPVTCETRYCECTYKP